jgi:hypothetical protein
MKVSELLEYFKNEVKPIVSAAACLGVHPMTIKIWEQSGNVPRQWAALFNQKIKQEKRDD